VGFPTRQTAIVGVYTTEQARHMSRSGVSLQLEAVKGALDDAGLSPAQVDGLIPMDPEPVPGAVSEHMFWAEQLGGHPVTFMETGIASGAVAKASAAIVAGLARVVLVFYGKAGWQLGPRGQVVPDRAPRRDEWGYELHGGYMAAWYAMWTRRYLHEFGYDESDLALVPVIHRYHATLNPASVMGSRGEISVQDVLGSRYVAEPLHMLDCSIDNDGGYAIVVASADVARDCRKKPAWILGGAEAAHTDVYMTIQDPWFPEDGASVRRTADRAFAMAGVTREDIDVAGLYDCFSITMVRDLEETGFCALGEGAAYVKEGHTRLGGSMPCNTDGGLLSHSHVANPSGLHTIEVVRQLRGECGARQVPGASVGLSLAQGWAVQGQAGTLILAAG
jgi:acetyl-CoA acetyltransferase